MPKMDPLLLNANLDTERDVTHFLSHLKTHM